MMRLPGLTGGLLSSKSSVITSSPAKAQPSEPPNKNSGCMNTFTLGVHEGLQVARHAFNLFELQLWAILENSVYPKTCESCSKEWATSFHGAILQLHPLPHKLEGIPLPPRPGRRWSSRHTSDRRRVHGAVGSRFHFAAPNAPRQCVKSHQPVVKKKWLDMRLKSAGVVVLRFPASWDYLIHTKEFNRYMMDDWADMPPVSTRNWKNLWNLAKSFEKPYSRVLFTRIWMDIGVANSLSHAEVFIRTLQWSYPLRWSYRWVNGWSSHYGFLGRERNAQITCRFFFQSIFFSSGGSSNLSWQRPTLVGVFSQMVGGHAFHPCIWSRSKGLFVKDFILSGYSGSSDRKVPRLRPRVLVHQLHHHTFRIKKKLMKLCESHLFWQLFKSWTFDESFPLKSSAREWRNPPT